MVVVTHLVPVRILVRPFARYGAGVVQHGPVLGGPQPLAGGRVRRQHLGPGGRRPEVLRARERVRPRVRRYHLRVAGSVRAAAVAVGVAHGGGCC